MFGYMKSTTGNESTLDSLGKILQEMGEYQHALKYYNRMMHETHLALANCHMGMSRAMYNTKCYGPALAHYKQNVTIREKELGTDHAHVGLGYSRMGVTLCRQGEMRKALKNLHKAEDIQQRTLPSNSVELAEMYNSLGIAYYKWGESKKAVDYFKKALDIRITILPHDHPDIGFGYNNLGTMLENDHQYIQALYYLKKSLEMNLKILPLTHAEIKTNPINYSSSDTEVEDRKTSTSKKKKQYTMAKSDPSNNSGGKFSSFARALWNPKRREFLGRDGGGWGKLGVFYFFFYIGLAGFFCSMLAVFMAISPRDRPRYFSSDSRMESRSSALSPGLGFRPQPDIEQNVILLDKDEDTDTNKRYIRSLDNYLQVFYWTRGQNDGQNSVDENSDDPRLGKKFNIRYPGQCSSEYGYGYKAGKPCVLVKMNKIIGFDPQPGSHPDDKNASGIAGCQQKQDQIDLHCYGEYVADADNIGKIVYHSEDDNNEKCGTLNRNRFPYEGKQNRQDIYQAPYVWVEFLNPKPNVLINVLCRVYGSNIEFEKKTGRGLTRFQVYIRDAKARSASRN